MKLCTRVTYCSEEVDIADAVILSKDEHLNIKMFIKVECPRFLNYLIYIFYDPPQLCMYINQTCWKLFLMGILEKVCRRVKNYINCIKNDKTLTYSINT